MSALTDFLQAAPVQTQDLFSMGKRAAMDFLNNGTSLTSAVVKEASACPGITTEQVKRIIEIANTTSFEHVHEKKAGSKIVDYPIAKPEEVLPLLEGKCQPVQVKVAAPEYSAPPPSSGLDKVAFDLSLARSFGVELALTESMEKAARLGLISKPLGMLQKAKSGVKKALTPAPKAPMDNPTLGLPAKTPGPKPRGKAPAQSAGPAPKPKPQPQGTPAKPGGRSPGLLDGMVLGGGGVAGASYLAGSGQPQQPHGVRYASDELIEQALFHAARGDDIGHLVAGDLEKMASVEAFEAASYEADPRTLFNSAVQTRQRAEKYAEEQVDILALLENSRQEFSATFGVKVASFLEEGGRFGEVADMLSRRAPDLDTQVLLNEASPAVQKLANDGRIDRAKLAADTAVYQLQSAQISAVRQVDPTHELVRAADQLIGHIRKMASTQLQAEKALEMLREAEAQEAQARELLER